MSPRKAPMVELCLLVALAIGCGGSIAAPDGAAGGAGGGGGAGAGGSGGSTATGCPAGPPSAASACAGAAPCFYEDCAGGGRTVASCVGGAWTVQMGPCASVECQGISCQPGQICIERAGGALLVDCVANGCGTGSVGCGCLQSCFGDCTATGSVEQGITIRCNTCPSGMCP